MMTPPVFHKDAFVLTVPRLTDAEVELFIEELRDFNANAALRDLGANADAPSVESTI